MGGYFFLCDEIARPATEISTIVNAKSISYVT